MTGLEFLSDHAHGTQTRVEVGQRAPSWPVNVGVMTVVTGRVAAIDAAHR